MKTPTVSLRTLQREREKNRVLDWKLFNQKAEAEYWKFELSLAEAKIKILREDNITISIIICFFCAILLFVAGMMLGGAL